MRFDSSTYVKEVQSWQSVQFVKRVLISETTEVIHIEEAIKCGILT